MNTFLYHIPRKKTVSFFVILTVILSVFLTTSADAATSQFSKILSYQGKLTTSSGTTVTDASYNFRFRIYTASSGGTAIFDETISTTTSSGLFSVQIGKASSTASLNFNQPLYIGITINDDSEMSPRKELSAAPFAFEADRLDGLDSSSFVQTNSTSSIASSSADTILTINQEGSGNILSLQKGGTSMLEVINDGNVGIGTSTPYAKLSVVGEVVASKFTATTTATSTFGGGISSAKGIDIVDPSACFSVAGVCIAGGGSGITSLRAEYSGAQVNVAQIFSTSSDTNLNLTITSSGGTHTFTPSWVGSLSVARGGTGLTTASLGDILVGNGTGYTAYSTSTLGLLTTNIAEGSNLYFTNDRFDARLSATTTLPNITTLLGLTNASTSLLTVTGNSYFGIIASGTWNGDAIGDTYLTKTGDWTGTLDGQEGSYYISNSFSSTSADYWKTTSNFYSTTSADYWYTLQDHFSTTSSDYWKTQNNFYSTTSSDFWYTSSDRFSTTTNDYWFSTKSIIGFSTTSADYWYTIQDKFSTTSADYYIHSSTTIPKTYTANTFTALNIFNYASTSALTVTGNSYFGIIASGTWNGDLIGDTYLTKTGDWTGTLDGQEGSYYISNSFSSTSADYWKTTSNFYSTTSADYWYTLQDKFSTTSADYYIHSSTTIPKTYTANTWTGLNIFGNSSSTLLTVSGQSWLGTTTVSGTITVNDIAAINLTGGNIFTTNNIVASLKELDTRLYNQQNATKEITGFPNRTDTSLSFEDSNRNFTITGTNFKIYSSGAEYNKNTESVAISNATGTYFIYYDNINHNLSTSTTAWSSTNGTVQVAIVYWDGVNGLIGDERHGIIMDGQTQSYLHSTVGTRYDSGLTGVFSTGVANTSNDPTFTMSSGSIYDEDIKIEIPATTTLRILYRNGSNYTFTNRQGNYYHEVSNILQYDNAGVLTPVTNNYFTAYWIFATDDPTTPIYSLMGQAEYNTLSLARANATYESLSLSNLPFREMKLLYRVIVKRGSTNETYQETQDLRSISNLPSGTYIATSHGVLTGLNNDDHSQYALLAGRTGGQTLVGSTDTDSGLIFQSTSGVGADGADIVFKGGSNGASEFMRILNNGNVGIGTSSPYTKFSVVGEILSSYFTATSTATSTFAGGINLTSGCFSIAGVCVGGEIADGTFSTTSADYWYTLQDHFSTTSADYWKTTSNFYSTTSADYWYTLQDKFSTTSADYYVHSSTTIPKTYTANTWTALNIFDNASTSALTVTNNSYLGTTTITNLSVTNTGTSTFSGNLNVQGQLQIGTGSIYLTDIATSTFSKGIDIASGCFSIGGVCVGAGGGSSDIAITDNITNAFRVREGTNDYININTTNSSEALSFWHSTAGTAANIIINTGTTTGQTAGVIKPSVAPENVLTARTITTVDSGTSANLAQYVSTAVGVDTFPVTAYYDGANGNLMVAKCVDVLCSGTATITTVESTNDVGLNVSIAIGNDGFPVISHFDTTNDDLRFVHCTNASCSTFDTPVALYTTGTAGQFSSIKIGNDGYPVISHNDGSSLLITHCGNATCTSGNTTTSVESGGQYTSIAIGNDGYPVVAYKNSAGTGVNFVHCTNASCSAYDTPVTVDTDPSSVAHISITIGSDSYPIMSYLKSVGGTNILYVAKCSSSVCTGTITKTSVDGAANSAWFSSIKIGTDNLPILSYSNSAGTGLKIIHCGNASCSSGNTSTSPDSSCAGGATSLAIGSDGFPVVGYQNTSLYDLKVIKCIDATCVSTTTPPYSGYGVDLGTSSYFFRKGYFANLYAKNTTVSSFDLAEEYPTKDSTLVAGEVVTLDPDNAVFVKRASTTGERVVGIVSSEPGVLLGGNGNFGSIPFEGEHLVPIALSGRVPVKVSDEGGAIEIGDNLSVSTAVPGTAKKASIGEDTIGVALEAYDGITSGETILVMVNNQSPSNQIEGNTILTGNVGIGTSTPKASLTVTGSLCVASTTTGCNGASYDAGTIYANNIDVRTAVDLAENYPTKDTTLRSGEIVSLDTTSDTTIKRAESNEVILGIISTQPGMTLGGGIENAKPVALSGRVPVKVNTEGGAIKIGDRISLSSEPGVGMKASTSSQTIGIALESYNNEPEKNNQILVFVNLSYQKLDDSIGSGNINSDSIWITDETTGAIKLAISQSLDLNNQDIKNVRSIMSPEGKWSLSEDGVLVVEEVRANKIGSKQICIDEICINKDDLKAILQNANITGTYTTPATEETLEITTTEQTDTPVVEQSSLRGDAEAPVISLTGSNTIELEVNTSGWVDPGATVTDNKDNNLGIQVSTYSNDTLISETEATVDTRTPATYIIKYNATDSAGNKATEVTRTVIVGEIPTPPTEVVIEPTPSEEIVPEPIPEIGVETTTESIL